MPINKTVHLKSTNEFSRYVEDLARRNGLTLLETVTEYCETFALEPREISSKLSKNLKAKLVQEGRDYNFLPKTPQIKFE